MSERPCRAASGTTFVAVDAETSGEGAVEDAWFRWVYLGCPSYAVDGRGPIAERHAALWFDTVAVLDGDDSWLQWWQANGPRRFCVLFPHFQDATARAQLAAMTADERREFGPRDGVTRSSDEFRVWRPYEADWTDAPPDLAAFVQEQVETAMEQARYAARMPPPPKPPWAQDR